MSWFNDFVLDYSRFTAVRSRSRGLKILLKTLGEPGLVFAFLMRIQLAFEAVDHMRIARLLHLLNLQITGAEVGHNCRIGPGMVVKHPLGLVLGGGSVIGENCTFLRNVTLGERHPDRTVEAARAYPTLGDNCMVGTGATILGSIIIGDNVKVGAHSLVLRDVPPGVTVMGTPARVSGQMF